MVTKEDLKKTILDLINRPCKEQMLIRDDLIPALEVYLILCETPDDLNVLNNWQGQGIWIGDARIIALLGAAGAKIYNQSTKQNNEDNKLIEHDKTLNLIRSMGVPETRSKSLSSAFNTLISRMDKEIDSLNREVKRLSNADEH